MNVSIWAGTAPSWATLDKALTFSFTEDGDSIPGPFAAAFRIGWFDEDYREASVSPNPISLRKMLLEHHSDGQAIVDWMSIRDEVSLARQVNTTVLLYDFEYPATIRSASFSGIDLHYVGTACVKCAD